MILQPDKQSPFQFGAFKKGQIMINKTPHTESLWLSAEQCHPWRPQHHQDLQCDDFLDIIKEKPGVLIIGTGVTLKPLPQQITAYLDQQQIGFETMSTHSAIKSHLILLNDTRQVITALLLT